ncbi:hypothetical protein G7Y79_00032g066510 [Physcia stellaris]|nr:hypothetical protein G7Y79_00032g066510 [Physcia stellaris]
MTKSKDPNDRAFLPVSAELVPWSQPLRPIADHSEAEKDSPQNASSPARSQTIPDFPYSRNSNFVGCEDILESIDVRLKAKSSVVLWGIGGVGKTEIATEYCYRVWGQYSDISIFWVPCDSLVKIELAFREIARVLGLGGHDDPGTDIVQLVSLHFQRGYAKHWLLVLDNADDVELLTKGKNALAKCIPTYRNGSIIVTSKDRYVAQTLTGRAHDTIVIERLSCKDALTLFRSRLPGGTKLDDAIELQILDILEYLPSGIAQAAAYIDYSNITLCEYLSELTESEAGLLKSLDEEHVDHRRGSDSPKSVFRGWKLSYEKTRSNYSQAGQLLSVMAFLDRQDVPRDLLQGFAGSRQQLNTALGILQGFRLINAESSKEYFRMHRLVQLATKFWLFGKKADYEALALKLVVANFCPDDSEDHIKQTAMIPHAKAVATYAFPDKDNALLCAKLQHSIASYDLRAGHYDAAAESCQSAYDKRRALCGEVHLDTLHSLALLGVIKRYQSLYEEARLLLSKVIDAKTTLLGADDLDTINSVSDLSEVLERQGKYDDSQRLAERAQRTRSNRLGDDDPMTLQSLMQLALLARRRAKYEKAKTLYRTVLKRYKETLPDPHEATLNCAYALAGVLRELNQYEEAITLSETVVEGRKALLGAEHPKTLLAINNLALGYRLKGELDRAERLYRSILAIHEARDHPEALQVCQNLAVILRDQAKYEDAEKIGRDTLAGRERVLGLDHLSTINTANDLAMTLGYRKAYPEAESLASRALEVRTRRLGENHTYSLDSLFTVASIKRDTGHLTEAMEMFQKVLDGRTKVLGPEHPATKETADALATLQMDSCKSVMWEEVELYAFDLV